MDNEKVINELMELLKIPISKVVVGSGTVEVWVNHFNIGNVDFDMEPGGIPIFKSSKEGRLRWDLVYSCWKNEIGECIKDVYGDEFDLDETKIIGFGLLLLKKGVNDKSPITVRASYDGKLWNIYKV